MFLHIYLLLVIYYYIKEKMLESTISYKFTSKGTKVFLDVQNNSYTSILILFK